MTLVLTVNGPESIWLLADRRLSFPTAPPRDDARKIMLLDTMDGLAILGYAGLGATALGTEPADWMGAVLRGRKLPLEQCLGVLAEAMKQQFPRHMIQMHKSGGPPAHHVVAHAFVSNQPQIYTIELVFESNRERYRFRYTRHVVHPPRSSTPRTPRAFLGGSGALHLAARHREWLRPLLRLVKAYDHGKISAHAVADHLASLNNSVHLADKSVGPRCVVVWRQRRGSAHKTGAGQKGYTGTLRDPNSPPLPTIVDGMDLHAILGVTLPHTIKVFDAVRKGHPAPEMDRDAINAELARLPHKPDENLL